VIAVNLKPGLYEQLVNTLLRRELDRLEQDRFVVQTEMMDTAEAHVVLSRYLQKVMQHAFQCVTGKNRFERQIQLCNRMIDVLNEFLDDPSMNQSIIPEETHILLGIFRHACLPPA
jgi:hypothetical protein